MTKASPPTVSCIVPVYNGARFLAEALDSILDQNWPAHEVLVVDDGSTDATADVLRGFGSRVRVLPQSNRGPAAARNAAIVRATGSFIAFLDADDRWLPGKLDRQLARFRQRPELMICFAWFRNIRGADSLEGDPLLDPAFWPVTPFSPCTLLARRAVFKQVGMFDPALRRGEDTEWFARVMMKGIRYETMPDVLVERRIHEANLSRDRPPSHESVLEAIKSALDRRRQEGW
jgi:glycosyltransferase involved in cell wall biosynthesis